MSENVARIIERFRRALADFDMLAHNDRVLVAVSGGQDSIALLHMLHSLPEARRPQLLVAHYNHGLRPEANAEEQFVRQFAETLGIETVAERGDVRKFAADTGMNLETAARELRYAFLYDAAARFNCNHIATGHTASDVAETLLMNILRGCGLDGLASIAPVRDQIIRPLLYIQRDQTRHYCDASGLNFCVDCTNDDTALRRNHIRLDLLPALEADYGPGVQQALLKVALAARSELNWTAPIVAENAARCTVPSSGDAIITVDVPTASALAPGLLIRVLRHACANANIDIRDFRWEHWQAMAKCIYGISGSASADLPGNLVAQRSYNIFTVAPAPSKVADQTGNFCVPLEIPGETKLPGAHFVIIEKRQGRPDEFPPANALSAVIDAGRAGCDLQARSVRPGDRFAPIGMQGTKKISDLLIDDKVPADRRAEIFAIVDGDDNILWLPGIRTSRIAAVDQRTEVHYILRSSDIDRI